MSDKQTKKNMSQHCLHEEGLTFAKRPKRQEKPKQKKETERQQSIAIGGDLSPSGNDMIVQLDMICQD